MSPSGMKPDPCPSPFQGKEKFFRSICGSGIASNRFRCRYLHHDDPYLKLGPFKLDVESEEPFIAVFRDFFTPKEMDFLVSGSKPQLSKRRIVDEYNDLIEAGRRNSAAKNVTRIIHKSVQVWWKEIEYEKYHDNLHEIEENFGYKIHHPVLYRLSKKLELAAGLNVTAKYASSDYQVSAFLKLQWSPNLTNRSGPRE